ncbi:hypothetical protein [Paraclostridium bifermentans]|uniref:hypothetical protein n=1 Tax=Paraclostridium bifermentans TaxID=1490 RepID=UPI0022E3A13C|nr:hypothetical protein [Paraclostridium bifermentans]
MELGTIKVKFTIEPGKELQCQVVTDEVEKDFLKTENEMLKSKISEMDYKFEKMRNSKKHRLEVKLIDSDNLLVIEGDDCIHMPEIIEQYMMCKDREFVCFGNIGVKKSKIEWYGIVEVN